MLSIKATYENGKIKLLEPIRIKEDANVIITFLDDDFSETSDPLPATDDEQSETLITQQDDQPEEYYEKLRAHKRYPAKGDITLIENGDELIYKLNDYSAGGLSFVADRVFEVSEPITAHISYQIDDEAMLMDFEMVVRGVFVIEEGRYKIGCQFVDEVDEELWHTIMG